MSIRFIAHYFCLKLRYSKNKPRILFYLMLINDFDLKRRKEKLGLILRSYIYLSSLKKRMADSKNRTGSSDFSKERLAILGFQLWISVSCSRFGRIEIEIRPVEEELTNTGRTRGQHTDETYEYLHRLNMHTTDNVLFLLDGGSIQSPRAAHIRPRTNSGYSAPKPPREYLAGLHRVNELTWDWHFSSQR